MGYTILTVTRTYEQITFCRKIVNSDISCGSTGRGNGNGVI
jgi:hypothetical protein